MRESQAAMSITLDPTRGGAAPSRRMQLMDGRRRLRLLPQEKTRLKLSLIDSLYYCTTCLKASLEVILLDSMIEIILYCMLMRFVRGVLMNWLWQHRLRIIAKKRFLLDWQKNVLILNYVSKEELLSLSFPLDQTRSKTRFFMSCPESKEANQRG